LQPQATQTRSRARVPDPKIVTYDPRVRLGANASRYWRFLG